MRKVRDTTIELMKELRDKIKIIQQADDLSGYTQVLDEVLDIIDKLEKLS